MDKLKIKKNIIVGLGGQTIAIVLGIIIPRIFITSYGSDVNGLLSTITQIFSYMALLEAGIGAAAQNALYKPFKDNNIDKISEIASAAQCYFRKFTLIYALGVILLALLLPFVIKSDVASLTISLIVIFEGMSGVFSFYFIETKNIIINVDGKSYINNTINLVIKILGYLVKIIMASFGMNILILQFSYFVIVLLKVLFYRIYFRKRYYWIKLGKTDKSIKLKDRNAYILTEVCWTIFSSTDMIVLSMFVSTKLSSVYGVYNMIFSNISLVLNSVYMSLVYLLGYSYQDNIEKYRKIHDAFNSIFIGIITILMSVCYILTIPFITLYTNGIKDANYIYTLLPMMFGLMQILSWSRYVSGNLTGLAGYAKQTSLISLFEAVTNLSLSIILVKKLGIIGVTLASVIALPVKVIWCTYVSDKKVMHRSYFKSYSIIGVNLLFYFAVAFISKYYHLVIYSYGKFFLVAIILTVFIGILGMILNFAVNRECWQVVRRYIIKK